MRRVPRRLAASIALAVLCGAGTARAEPQANAGLTLGVATHGRDRDLGGETAFHLGLRGDLLLGRTSNRSFGAGPFLHITTNDFADLAAAAGGTLHVPVHEHLPVLVSAGLSARAASSFEGLEPGLEAQLFWGSRSFNYHSSYVLAAGLTAGLRYGLGPSRDVALTVAAQLDVVALALPFVLLVEWLSGPRAR